MFRTQVAQDKYIFLKIPAKILFYFYGKKVIYFTLSLLKNFERKVSSHFAGIRPYYRMEGYALDHLAIRAGVKVEIFILLILF